MIRKYLHENWTMKQVGWDKSYPAVVPGSVYNDMLANGLMEDPYYRDNEDKALALMAYDYEYETTFAAEAEYLEKDDVILKFDAIDTVADIYLNDALLASVDNMHREWEFHVKEYLKAENHLKLVFHSPTKCIKERYANDPVEGTEDAMQGFPQLRKPHYMFGWDWGPRTPDAGIWRAVSLIGVEQARFTSVYVLQEHEGNKVTLKLEEMVQPAGENEEYMLVEELTARNVQTKSGGRKELVLGQDYDIVVTVKDPDGALLAERQKNPKQVEITEPKLWWPNGYGAQPLYTVTVELVSDDVVLDTWEKRIGLRTMTIHREKDEYGEQFAHKVNGIKVFAMGADYIPEDNILSRTNPERTRDLLNQCVAAHFNCIRVWGGGCYPEDYFYDICDELGLMVWQDFMFACAVYHLTEEFEENIAQEIVDNVRRLRHHASLGLWCGNNEMEQFVDEEQWGAKFTLKSDYVKMYEYLFPKILKKEDPQTFYWPASPSSGGGFDNPNDENRGDVHYWAVWHGNKPFTEYRKFYFRYLSEFGFQSFPSIKTIETFTEPRDRNVFSHVMEKHQRNAAANGKIMNYMEQTFLYPNSLDTLVYASQLLQAEAIRYGVEHFRRNRGRCMGTVYWQLNDCWPVASWASIDYYGRWKALHYYAKRFFAPLMLSCQEEGLISQTQNVNAEPFEVEKSIRLNVANETLKAHEVKVVWQLRNAKGEVKREESTVLHVEPLSASWLDKTDLSEASLYSDYVSYQMYEEGALISEGSVLFCPPKHFEFVEPELTVRTEGDEIIVSSKYFAKSIEIRNENDDLILTDNFFDLHGGEKRVKILKGSAEGITVRSVYNIC